MKTILQSVMLTALSLLLLSPPLPTHAAKKMTIDTRRYARICTDRHTIADNDKRSHAALKLAIESSSLTSILSRDSPQHRAMCWMIHDDAAKIDPRGAKGKAKWLERYALGALYFNTKGPGWSRSDMWMTKEPVCNWYGIKCTSNLMGMGTKYITSVDLSFNKVTGIIPSEIGYLTELRELDLNGNSLQGVLPQLMFRNLKKLQKLNLHMNDLFGAIPREVGLLKNLKELTLFGNFFFGKIPLEISDLKKLENLDLYANNLTGSIPASIGKLKSLKEFYVNDNEVVGKMPNEVCALKLEHVVSDCLGARPEVPCACCTICCQGLPDPKCRDMSAAGKKKNIKKKVKR